MNKRKAKLTPGLVYCDQCDGCGWVEGGKKLRTPCGACMGTGVVKTKRAKKARPNRAEVIRRRLIGLNILGNESNSPPLVYAIYEEDLLEKKGKTMVFSTRAARGDSIQVAQHSGMLNGSKKEKAYYLRAYRPDLWTNIQAAATLYQQLRQACVELDEARGMKEF